MPADTFGFHPLSSRSCAPVKSAGARFGTEVESMGARLRLGTRRGAASDLGTKSQNDAVLGILQLSATSSVDIISPACEVYMEGIENQKTDNEMVELVAEALSFSSPKLRSAVESSTSPGYPIRLFHM